MGELIASVEICRVIANLMAIKDLIEGTPAQALDATTDHLNAIRLLMEKKEDELALLRLELGDIRNTLARRNLH